MAKSNFKNQNGEGNSKQIVIIASITLVAALMIIAIFVILSRGKTNDTATNDFLKTIEAQRQNQNKPGGADNAGNTQETLALTGVLSEIKTDSLVIIEKDTQNKITISLPDGTTITYSGQTFDRSRFYVGDQLEITANNIGGPLQAQSIKVIVSASPATAVPVPVTPNISPSGSFRPLGVE